MKVTEAIAMEHATLLRVFDEVERLLPHLQSLAEVAALATVLEALLTRHGRLEIEFAFLPLDHALHQDNPVTAFHCNHQELDDRLQQVQRASTPKQARQLLRAAIRASRQHFLKEDQEVLPLLMATLSDNALHALGHAFRAAPKLLYP